MLITLDTFRELFDCATNDQIYAYTPYHMDAMTVISHRNERVVLLLSFIAVVVCVRKL